LEIHFYKAKRENGELGGEQADAGGQGAGGEKATRTSYCDERKTSWKRSGGLGRGAMGGGKRSKLEEGGGVECVNK